MLDRVVHTLFVVVVALVSVGLGKPEWKRYTSKNSRRHDFQVELAIAFMNFAIEQDWDGGSERPSWMRQKAFVPCNCGECYFCIHGHTTGVQHRQKTQKVKMVHLKSGTLARADKCSNAVYVDLGKGSSYCRQCMRGLRGAVDSKGNKLDKPAKRRLCTYSSKGCPQPGCREQICDVCWEKGYDGHKNID